MAIVSYIAVSNAIVV